MLNFLKRGDSEKQVTPPVTMIRDGKTRFFEAFGEPMLKLQRRELADLLHWFVTLVMVLVLWRMAEPTVSTPFLIEADPKSGATALSNRVARQFTPNELNRLYEARRWVSMVWVGDAALTPTNLVRAMGMTRGKAVQELTAFIAADRPTARLVADPLWTRTVEILSSNPLSDGGTDVVIVRARVSESNGKGERTETIKVITLHYVILGVKSVEEAEKANAIGLYITHFSQTNETVTKS